ncbi:uncharacterized protein K452DRAFT_219925 [Aplosporella prunicola CBS 121167]|uniref:Anaphase-promoting complex subunit 5 n=1 Tax=Aplosporella prunicola CBS 121167 TaxID=1176127 RepID=A0A6A6BQ46_9PEZI|nr:uncharacterized protein K452DRAFT_219925 [Aplosporella prunicola CBS 121167]KAF2146216.1 hypothetical protein K452DRAFT_219925 [Aplosporella prunicola CBS 121167]
MARYLNPQKISLLVLSSLYCDSVLPVSATLPILSFITAQIIPPSLPHFALSDSENSNNGVVSIHDFENALASVASISPDQTLLDLFLERLWSIDSLDALHEFFDGLSDLLAKPGQGATGPEAEPSGKRRIYLSRTSPLGMFIRRAQLEFTRLQFYDASKLWSAFINYRQPTAASGLEQTEDPENPVFDANLPNLDAIRGDDLFEAAYGHLARDKKTDALASTDEIERLLAFQIDQLQRFGNRVPDDMKEGLRQMLGPTSTTPSLAHFVSRFFDAWRAGDYTSSFDHLHRYFDYTMQTRDKTYYQYALLHMAILQADFGCFSEAIAAMNETIATARENQDMSCLNFSLSWLNHLSKAYPKQIKASGYGGMLGTERDGLAFLKSKAKETKMWSLLSATLLSEAKMLLSNGGPVPRAFEQIFQCSHLNITHCLTSNQGAQMLMQASMYGRLGMTHLSNTYCDVLRVCYGSVCPVDDILRSICHTAFISSQSGSYSEALKILESVKTADHRTLKFHQYVVNNSALLRAKRALRRSDTDTAAHFIRQLQSFSPSDPEILFQLATLSIHQQIRNGCYSAALQRIEDLLAELKAEDADLYQRIHLLTMKAMLFCRTGEPEKGFSVAMRAASAAHRARLWPALWEAVCVIAETLVALGEFAAASRLADAIIPQVLEAGDKQLCAKLYAVQADAHVGLGGHAMASGSSYEAEIVQADLFLDKAGQCFHQIEDVRGESETLAKKALLGKLRGDEAGAAKAATESAKVVDEAGERGVGVIC